MTNEQILAAFVRPEVFPEEAIALAEERQEEIAPLLIAEIESWTGEKREDIQGLYYAVDIAFHLLAEWRDTRAFKPMLALWASPNLDVLGDTLTEEGAALLSRLYDDDVEALCALIFNQSADQFVRNAALETYIILVREGAIPRHEAHDFLVKLFDTMPHETDYAWCGWADAVAGFLFEDLFPKVKQLCDEDAIDMASMDYEDFEMEVESARQGMWQPRSLSCGSAIETMRDWRYTKEVEEEERAQADDADLDEEDFFAGFDEPAVNPYRDIGRNDPCPCGSGKKFKKCCLPKVEAGEM